MSCWIAAEESHEGQMACRIPDWHVHRRRIGANGPGSDGETALGSVRIPRSVKADGKDLKAGTYQVRLTAQAASPAVPGQTMERWVEFVQGGKVVGREVVSIVPAAEVKDLQPGPDCPAGVARGLEGRNVEGE